MTKKDENLTINGRINSIIDTLFSGNKSAFANAVGITPSVVDNITGKRNGKPSFDVLVKISAIAEINMDWLIKGEGEMLAANSGICQNGNDHPQLIPSESGIPMIPLDAMAGAFAGEVQIMDYDCERYVVPGMQRADFLIPVKGDSMLPSYSPGDIVACVRVPLSDVFFQWGRVYVLDTAQGAIIKRVRKSASPSEIMIFSDNADKYEPFTLPVSEIHSLALVIGLIRLE